jgi:hypothetical protein
MELSAENVRAVLTDCLYKEEESVNDALYVEGIMRKFGLHPERLKSHEADVREMLAELPDEFMAGKGGGWSFLNMCFDKNNRHWGEHPDMEALIVLGLGLGLASFPLPRDMWDALPGSMPYVQINLTAKVAA